MATSRKTVTVLFCDLVGSTQLGERLDPERLRSVLADWYEAMREPIERHGGTVEKFIGDAVMAVFGVPHVHEDDALRAVRAAAEMRTALLALNEELVGPRQPPLEIRIGINTGEVVTSDAATTLVSGDAVNIAKRFEQAAPAGEILIGAETRRLVAGAARLEPVAPVEAKGKGAPLEAWRVVATIPGASAFPRRLNAPLVGRVGELATLRDELERAARERSCRFATLLGPAGIGKSRLAAAIAAEAPASLFTRCVPYGDSFSVLPIVTLIAAAGGSETIDRIASSEPDGPLIATRLRDAAVSAEERQWGVRRLVEWLARDEPLVVCVEDVHWAHAPLLDLLEYLAGWTTDAPVLVVCMARPELLELRPRWPGVKLSLAPLDEAESTQLLDELAAEWPLSAAARAQVLDVAEGNPLFVEQMVAMLADHGSVSEVPPTINALLAARLDGLAPAERAVLERASIVGRHFTRGDILALTPDEERADVASALLALARKDFLIPWRTEVDGEDGFRFRHALIRDATYAATSKSLRADLHTRMGEHQARLGARDEAVGYHWEQATHLRADLGERDDETARRAGELLANAGLRAGSNSEATAAAGLLRRSLALLPPLHPRRPEVLYGLSAALWSSGDADGADRSLDDALTTAHATGDARTEWYCRLDRAARTSMSSRDSTPLVQLAERAIDVFGELGDELGLARAWRRLALAASAERGWGKAVAAWERAHGHAVASGDELEVARAADALCTSLLFGPTPVAEALERVRAVADGAGANAVLHANAITALAALLAMRGELEPARAYLAEARDVYEPLGLTLGLAGWGEIVSFVESLAGERAAAVQALRQSFDLLDTGGHVGYRTMIAAHLALQLALQGDTSAARHFVQICERGIVRSDIQTEAELMATRALLDQNETEATAAVELAERTEDVNLRASMQLVLARITGDPAALDAARTLYRAKGNIAAEHLVREVERDIVASVQD